jgi:hypothetical protein
MPCFERSQTAAVPWALIHGEPWVTFMNRLFAQLAGPFDTDERPDSMGSECLGKVCDFLASMTYGG